MVLVVVFGMVLAVVALSLPLSSPLGCCRFSVTVLAVVFGMVLAIVFGCRVWNGSCCRVWNGSWVGLGLLFSKDWVFQFLVAEVLKPYINYVQFLSRNNYFSVTVFVPEIIIFQLQFLSPK